MSVSGNVEKILFAPRPQQPVQFAATIPSVRCRVVELPKHLHQFTRAVVSSLSAERQIVDYQVSVVRGVLNSTESHRFELTLHDRKSSRSCLYLTEMTLIEFRQMLNERGIASSLDRGVLSCGPQSSVKVIKSGGQFHLLGSMSSTYLKVRQLLINQFRVI